MLESIFREYDIRGIVGEELNENSVKAIGYFLGLEIIARGAKKVSVGHDARTSANDLFIYLASGLNAAGLEVYNIGMLPTPVGYFSVFSGIFGANVMITGSHNPKEYNGFKITIGEDSFFGEDIRNLGKKVVDFVNSGKTIDTNVNSHKFDVLTPYTEFYGRNFTHLRSLGEKFICDCANGVAAITLKPIISALNLDATLLYEDPDGTFPNHHPDPSVATNLKDLREAMKKSGAKFGFGFDGDADRIAVLTPKRIVKGDELAYLYAKNMKNPRVLGEVKCSQNMYDEIDKIGKAFMGKTGHSNIKKAMKELNIDMAAEVSGHIFFKERYFGFDDAVYAMVRVLELIAKGMDLDAELDALPKLYSTDELKIAASEENKFKIIGDLKDILLSDKKLPKIIDIIDIDGVRVKFEHGWALVRASNTTPVLVTRFEADSEEFLARIQGEFTSLVEKIRSKYE